MAREPGYYVDLLMRSAEHGVEVPAVSTSRRAKHASASNEWGTPPEIIEAARAALGGEIDLDPASTGAANERIGARDIFTKDNVPHGLARPWFGCVFLNPPGGRASAKTWWFKLLHEWAAGRVEQAVFLAFSVELLQTAQLGGSPTLPHPSSFPMCFPRRRLAFLGPDGKPLRGNTHASVLIYVPPQEFAIGVSHDGDVPSVRGAAVRRFADAFEMIGALANV